MLSDLFNHPGIRKAWLKIRYLLAPIFLVILLRYMQPEYLLAGFLVSLFGELIQTWSFASLVKNIELTVRGPYVIVRNPMYLGRYFLVLGFVLLFGQLWLVILFTVVYVLYMVNRVKREEQRLVETLEGYDEYRRKVRAFIPGKGVSDTQKLWYFSWDTLRNNHGDSNFLVFMLIYAIVFTYALFFK
jgi:protein-S-isoprenylcysteine O-methyltransferase Ste14